MRNDRQICPMILSYALIPTLLAKLIPFLAQYINAFSFMIFGLFIPLVGTKLYPYFGMWLIWSSLELSLGVSNIVNSGMVNTIANSMLLWQPNMDMSYANYMLDNQVLMFIIVYMFYSIPPFIIGLVLGRFINKKYRVGLIH